jgi:hypothetical protein
LWGISKYFLRGNHRTFNQLPIFSNHLPASRTGTYRLRALSHDENREC